MRLESSTGGSLRMSVVGYQFPDLPGSRGLFDHDANWLVALGEASDGERAWAFRDPCLLTTEARNLVDWLHAVANDRPADDAIDFTEPNLEFRLTSPPGAQPVIRVTFRLESRPPWNPNITEEDWDSAYLDFDMAPDAVRAAADELRSELEQYPER
jgi:hypothetical protein